MRASLPAGVILLPVALALAACGRHERTDAAPRASASASGAPSPSASVATTCPQGQHALQQRVVSGATTCSVDDDCTCIDLPQAERTPGEGPFCGVVVPKSRAGALRDDNDRLASSGCAPSACPAATCEAICVPRAGGGFCDKRSRCKEITIEADALVKRLDRGCRRDADCAGYPAGIAHDCGGVAKRSSVEPLLALAREFHQRSCMYATNCAPRAASRPACRDNTCIEVPR